MKISGDYGMCVTTEGPAKGIEIKELLVNNLGLYFGIARNEYCWIYPYKTYYSVGIGEVAKNFLHPKKSMLNFLRKNDFFSKYEIHGHNIPRGGVESTITYSRILLVGDRKSVV